MGQKVNPVGYRLGVNKDWESRWYAKEDYANKLNKDIKIRPRVDAPFVMRGSYHILSDQQRLGWHIDYKKKLEELTTLQEALDDETVE